jgi:hypothetical protein
VWPDPEGPQVPCRADPPVWPDPKAPQARFLADLPVWLDPKAPQAPSPAELPVRRDPKARQAPFRVARRARQALRAPLVASLVWVAPQFPPPSAAPVPDLAQRTTPR